MPEILKLVEEDEEQKKYFYISEIVTAFTGLKGLLR